jgi:hypothetical protein
MRRLAAASSEATIVVCNCSDGGRAIEEQGSRKWWRERVEGVVQKNLWQGSVGLYGMKELGRSASNLVGVRVCEGGARR